MKQRRRGTRSEVVGGALSAETGGPEEAPGGRPDQPGPSVRPSVGAGPSEEGAGTTEGIDEAGPAQLGAGDPVEGLHAETGASPPAGDPVEAEPSPGDGPGWTFHDFQRPRPLREREVQALEALHWKFARTLSSSLSVLARSRVHVELVSVAQRTYFDFIRSLSNPTSLHLVYAHPQRVPLVLEMGLSAVFPLIERLLGGKGDGLRQPSRPLSRIEQRLASSLAEKVLAALTEIWGQGPDLRLDLAEAEHNPLLLQIVGPSEPTLVLAFEVVLGIRTGSLHLAFPLKLFEDLLARLIRASQPGSTEERNTPEDRDRILRRISASELTMTVEIPPIPIRLQDLVTMRPGDMIDTQIQRGTELPVLIDGHRLLRGQMASQDGRRVVRIVRAEGE